MVDGPDDSGGDDGVDAGAGCVENLDRHDRAQPADARYTLIVVGAGSNDSCDRGAVALVVPWIGVRVHEVATRHERAAEVRLVRIDAGIDDRDDDPARSAGDVPRLRETRDAETDLLRPVAVVRTRVQRVYDRLASGRLDRCRASKRGQGVGATRGVDVEEVGGEGRNCEA